MEIRLGFSMDGLVGTRKRSADKGMLLAADQARALIETNKQ
jgi:hypothetical protein